MKKQLQEHASSVVSRLEPSEKDDLISRKALMQRLHDAGGCGAPPESWADGYDKAIDLAYGMAENAPTIDPVTAAAEALGMSPDRLRELAQAEKEGRLVVLPCDVGDKLYDVTLGEVREKIVISLSMLLSKSVNHLVIHAENFRNAVTSYELQDIGKTVFLTREAAEAALDAMGGENNA